MLGDWILDQPENILTYRGIKGLLVANIKRSKLLKKIILRKNLLNLETKPICEIKDGRFES